MDFVVVGLGLGAIGILVGLLLRDAAGWRFSLAPAREAAPDQGAPSGRARLLRGFGNALLLCGLVLTALTLIALVTGLSDQRGALLVTGSVTLILIALLAWLYDWSRRQPRRRVARPAAVASGGAGLAAAPATALLAAAASDEVDGAADLLESDLAAAHEGDGADEEAGHLHAEDGTEEGEVEGFSVTVESTVLYQETAELVASETETEVDEVEEVASSQGHHAAMAEAGHRFAPGGPESASGVGVPDETKFGHS